MKRKIADFVADHLLYPLYSKWMKVMPYMKARYYQKSFVEKTNICGKGVRMNGKFTVMNFRGLIIGENVHIGDDVFIDARGGVFIGDHTHISRRVTIYSSNHDYEGQLLPYDNNVVPRRVIIGRSVWIGMNVSIVPGVTIGDGAIIAMGTVVSKPVPDGAIVGGNQQRIIGNRNLDNYSILNNENRFGGPSGVTLSPAFFKQKTPDITFVLSTGRSGSKAITDTYSSQEDILALHEPMYAYLKHFSFDYLSGKISKEDAQVEINRIFNSITFDRSYNKVLISDQKLVPFIDILSDVFPAAKFIWIVRRPKSFLKSAAARGWYDGDESIIRDGKVILRGDHITEGTRITGLAVGQYDEESWAALSQSAKILWYWKFWNRLIEDGFEKIGEGRKIQVRLNELSDSLPNVTRFLFSENRDIEIRRTNQVWKTHRSKYKELSDRLDSEYSEYADMVQYEESQWFDKNQT